MLRISAGGFEFTARLEEEAAPETVAAFRRLLPLESKIIHVRWSGEAGWIPFGDLALPGGRTRAGNLVGHGYVNFASKAGQLAGNHFATVTEGNENLRPLGV